MKPPGQGRGACAGAGPDLRLLAHPLRFLHEDHLRERQLCAELDALAATPRPDRAAMARVLRILNEELNVHLRDEAEDLFPLLVRRCTEEDAIERALDRIRLDRDAAARLLPRLRGALTRALDTGNALTARERAVMRAFAAHVRRHLVAENAIVLPIARARLTGRDLRTLSRGMRRRRGLLEQAKTPDAD